VIEAVTRMAEQGKEKHKLSSLYAEVTEQTLQMLQHENDIYSEKEKMTLLCCFATILANRRLDPKDENFNRYLEKGISFLVRGYKEGIRKTYSWLESVGNNDEIPDQFRKQIKDILKTLQTTAVDIYGGIS
jgi:hypothetical protein